MGRKLNLDLTSHPIPNDTAFDLACSGFAGNFRIAPTTSPYFTAPVYEVIKFPALSGIINTLRNSTLDLNKNDDSFVRGIRIYLGLESNNAEPQVWKIRLIVVPVCLDLKSGGVPPKENFEYTPFDPPTANDEIYLIEGENLVPVLHSTVTTMLNNYAAQIKIARVDAIAPAPPVFDDFDAGEGDVHAVFFPFQEIQEVYDDNLPTAIPASPTPIVDDKLYVVSVNVNYNGKNRHSIAISPFLLVAHKAIGRFTGKAANLANLCPPHCSILEVSINRAGPTPIGTIVS